MIGAMQEDPALSIEPGLLKSFRQLVLAEGLMLLVLNFLIVFSSERYRDEFGLESTLFLLTGFGALWSYLKSLRLRQILKRFYLPAALGIFLILPYLGKYWAYSISQPLAKETDWLTGLMSLFLFIPLMLIAWQYSFRWVIGFALITTLLEGLLTWFTGGFNGALIEDILIGLLFVAIIQLLIGWVVWQIMRMQRAQRQSLSEAHQDLMQYANTLEQLTISRERNRLARELHDTLAHTLSGVSVQLEAMRVLWDVQPEQAKQILNQTLLDTRNGLNETRTALADLRANPLNDLGLVRALEDLAQTTAARCGFHLHLDLASDLDPLPASVQHTVYRITQEAFSNIDRHALAKNVSVRLEHHQRKIDLTISDDGVGFEPKAIHNPYHLGIKGMKERAILLGGQFSLHSQPGKGTDLHFSLES